MHLKLCSPSQPVTKKPNRPWFDEECRILIAQARRARSNLPKYPLSLNKRMLWSEADAKKKRHIIHVKKKAWDEFSSQLDHCKDQNFVWTSAKKKLVKGKINGVATDCFRFPSG